ncbi:MAG: hypothetical protein HY319_32665 [Armatimonadetes bacterium]|nr:hypothetical protein [Armatimonadota bacterium]
MGQLDDFLEEQKGLGKRESEGAFTLDLTRAQFKLGQYQSADPAFFLLKLVQAGVLAGARSIDIKLLRWDVQVDLHGLGEGLESADRLLELLRNPLSEEESAARHLALALLSATSRKPAFLHWVFQHPAGGYAVDSAGGQSRLCRLYPSPRTTARFLFREGANPVAAAQHRAVLHQAVSHRCRYSTTEIRMDGWTVNRGVGSEPVPSAPWLAQLSRPFLVGEYLCVDSVPSSDSLLAMDPRRRRVRCAEVGPSHGTGDFDVFLQLWEGVPRSGTFPCRWAIQLPAALEGPSSLTLVRAGVTLDPVEIELGAPGVRVLGSSTGLKTDLSEFQVTRGEAFDALVEEARAALEQLKRQVRDHVWMLECRPAGLSHRGAAIGAIPGLLLLQPAAAIPGALFGGFVGRLLESAREDPAHGVVAMVRSLTEFTTSLENAHATLRHAVAGRLAPPRS